MWSSDKEKKELRTGCLLWIGFYAFVFFGIPFIVGDYEEEPNDSTEINRFYSDSFHASDKDCSDFSSTHAAQVFYEEAGSADPHDLDRDGDGYACEWND